MYSCILVCRRQSDQALGVIPRNAGYFWTHQCILISSAGLRPLPLLLQKGSLSAVGPLQGHATHCGSADYGVGSLSPANGVTRSPDDSHIDSGCPPRQFVFSADPNPQWIDDDLGFLGLYEQLQDAGVGWCFPLLKVRSNECDCTEKHEGDDGPMVQGRWGGNRQLIRGKLEEIPDITETALMPELRSGWFQFSPETPSNRPSPRSITRAAPR